MGHVTILEGKIMKRYCYSLCIISAVAFAALMLCSSPAFAQTKVHVVPASEFVPTSHTFDYVRGNAFLYSTDTSLGITFIAPIDLPAGSQVKKVVLACIDHGSNDIAISVLHSNITSWKILKLWSSSGSGAGVRFFGRKISFTIKTGMTYELFVLMPKTDAYQLHHVRVIYE